MWKVNVLFEVLLKKMPPPSPRPPLPAVPPTPPPAPPAPPAPAVAGLLPPTAQPPRGERGRRVGVWGGRALAGPPGGRFEAPPAGGGRAADAVGGQQTGPPRPRGRRPDIEGAAIDVAALAGAGAVVGAVARRDRGQGDRAAG